MSITMSSINFGGILVPLLVLGLESHGFRWTTAGIGAFLLIIAVPAYALIRNRPEDYGMERDGGTLPQASTTVSRTSAQSRDAEANFTVAEALRTRAFWILTLVGIASGVPLMALGVHLFPKLTDMGFSDGTAGLVILTFDQGQPLELWFYSGNDRGGTVRRAHCFERLPDLHLLQRFPEEGLKVLEAHVATGQRVVLKP